MKQNPENRTVGEFVTNSATFIFGSGKAALGNLRRRGREFNAATQKGLLEQRDRDAMAIYTATNRFFEGTDSPVAEAEFEARTSLIPDPGRLIVARDSVGVLGTSILFVPNIMQPNATDIHLRPVEAKIPKRVTRVTTLLKFVLAQGEHSQAQGDYYETLRETEIMSFPTRDASSWRELTLMVSEGQIQGDPLMPEQVGFHGISHADAEAYATCLSYAKAV